MSNGLIPPLNVNSGEIENWGIEANIGYRFNSHWNVNANYSWLHMENPVLAAPEHKLYVGADIPQVAGLYRQECNILKDFTLL